MATVSVTDSTRKVSVTDSPRRVSVTDSPRRVSVTDSPLRVSVTDSPRSGFMGLGFKVLKSYLLAHQPVLYHGWLEMV